VTSPSTSGQRNTKRERQRQTNCLVIKRTDVYTTIIVSNTNAVCKVDRQRNEEGFQLSTSVNGANKWPPQRLQHRTDCKSCLLWFFINLIYYC